MTIRLRIIMLIAAITGTRLLSDNDRNKILPISHFTLQLAMFPNNTVMNYVPPALRMCTSPDTFLHHLKTHYFQHVFQLT